MIRAAICTLAIIMAASILYQSQVASWHSAWLLALTYACGIGTGVLVALVVVTEPSQEG